MIVFFAAGRPQVHVLKPVGQRPTIGSRDREWSHAEALDGVGCCEQLLPGGGGSDAGIFEHRHVIPERGLVSGLEHQTVERAICLLYTSDAADDLLCVDLGGRRIIKKKKKK